MATLGNTETPVSSCGDWVLSPENFHTLSIPVPGDDDDVQLENPFALPLEYAAVLRERTVTVEALRARLVTELNENERNHVEEYLRAKFLEWLWSSGQMRQVLELIQIENPAYGSQQQQQQQPPPQQQPQPPPPPGSGGSSPGVSSASPPQSEGLRSVQSLEGRNSCKEDGEDMTL